MEVITIDSEAFAKIITKLNSIEDNFKKLKEKAENPLKDMWLDNQDVMLLLKISKRTLQRYRDENILAFSQIGNKMYYKSKDIDLFLENNYHKTASLR